MHLAGAGSSSTPQTGGHVSIPVARHAAGTQHANSTPTVHSWAQPSATSHEPAHLHRQESDPLTNILQDYIQRSDARQNRMADAVMGASTVRGSFGVFLGNMCQELTDDNFIKFSRKTIALYYEMRERQASQSVAPPQTSTFGDSGTGPADPPSTPANPYLPQSGWPATAPPPPQSQSTPLQPPHQGQARGHRTLYTTDLIQLGLGCHTPITGSVAVPSASVSSAVDAGLSIHSPSNFS